MKHKEMPEIKGNWCWIDSKIVCNEDNCMRWECIIYKKFFEGER